LSQSSVLILVLSACVAVGLWMQNQQSAHAVLRGLERDTGVQLRTRADALAAALADKSQAELASVSQFALIATGVDPQTIVVDSSWRITHMDRSERDLAPGRQVRWTVAPGSDQSARIGRFAGEKDVYVAAVAPLAHQHGYVICSVPLEQVNRRAAAVTASLPSIAGVTMLWTEALIAIAVFLTMCRLADRHERERKRSHTEALRQTQSLMRTRDAVIFGLAKLAESRDNDTGEHLERISAYSTTLATALRRDPRYAGKVNGTFVKLIGLSSALHDIGKVGIDDRILRKPGRFNEQERIAMQAHSRIGDECLRQIEQRLGSSNFLQMARAITLSHHERWDGTGNPRGLKGEEIPLEARIVAIADVYDALSSKRVYKDAMPHETCVEIIRDDAGKHFDPTLVEVWLKIERVFRRISEQYRSEQASGDLGRFEPDPGPRLTAQPAEPTPAPGDPMPATPESLP